MNTRQKLTLGIAAIFMVTLTIVGVTYAYFVTRVNTPNGNTTVDVQAATLSTVEYAEGNGVVTMEDVLPGDVEYKTFKVKNNNANASQYSVILASAKKDASAPSFVHTTATNATTVCYEDGAYDLLHSEDPDTSEDSPYSTLLSTCYEEGAEYNSIRYDLYEVSSTEYASVSGDVLADNDENDDDFEAAISGKTAKASGNVEEGTGTYNVNKIEPTATPQVILPFATIAAGTQAGETFTPSYVYYVLKITYEEENDNQNIENRAALEILVSIK